MAVVGILVGGFIAHEVIQFIFDRYFWGKKNWIDKTPYLSNAEKEIYNVLVPIVAGLLSELGARKLHQLLGALPYTSSVLRRFEEALEDLGGLATLSACFSQYAENLLNTGALDYYTAKRWGVVRNVDEFYSQNFRNKLKKWLESRKPDGDIDKLALKQFLQNVTKNAFRGLPSEMCKAKSDALKKKKSDGVDFVRSAYGNKYPLPLHSINFRR